MKKLLVKTALFLCILILLDYGIGNVLEHMYFSIETGTSGARINNILNDKYDVYVMGASTARYGYIPKIIEEELGLSVYNAGENGINVLYNYALLQLILKHHKPKLIVWEISNGDYYDIKENSILHFVMPYHKYPLIDRMLCEADEFNRIAMYSKMFPYNQKVLAIFAAYFSNNRHSLPDYRGYDQLYGFIDPAFFSDTESANKGKYQKKQTFKANEQQNRVIQKYFHAFISECQTEGIKLIAFSSPRAPVSADMASVTIINKNIQDHLTRAGVPFIGVTASQYPVFYNFKLYKDVNHLNHNGATVLSEIVAKNAKEFMQKGD